MLPEEAFLRRMPRAIDLEERLLMDGLVTSADLAAFAFGRLRERLAQYEAGQGTGAPDRIKILELAHFSWAIVDQIHNFRSTARRLSFPASERYEAFIKRTADVTTMRNGMDHMFANTRNRAKKKKAGFLPYGHLSYVVPVGLGLAFNVINLGSIQEESFISPLVDTHQVPDEGICRISLAAFDQQIYLDEILSSLEEIIIEIDAFYEERITEQIRAICRQENIDPEKVLAYRLPRLPHMKVMLPRWKERRG